MKSGSGENFPYWNRGYSSRSGGDCSHVIFTRNLWGILKHKVPSKIGVISLPERGKYPISNEENTRCQ
jgi:hypothetical protein